MSPASLDANSLTPFSAEVHMHLLTSLQFISKAEPEPVLCHQFTVGPRGPDCYTKWNWSPSPHSVWAGQVQLLFIVGGWLIALCLRWIFNSSVSVIRFPWPLYSMLVSSPSELLWHTMHYLSLHNTSRSLLDLSLKCRTVIHQLHSLRVSTKWGADPTLPLPHTPWRGTASTHLPLLSGRI